jgi:hypothetical protein
MPASLTSLLPFSCTPLLPAGSGLLVAQPIGTFQCGLIGVQRRQVDSNVSSCASPVYQYRAPKTAFLPYWYNGRLLYAHDSSIWP